MAKSARGLPEDFALDLPDEKPVLIGDFLDEEPMMPVVRAKAASAMQPERLHPELVRTSRVGEVSPEASPPPRSAARAPQGPAVILYQLNLSPRSKKMLDELVEYVCAYSPETDARTSEVFQGIVTLLHNALDELQLSELPWRGAWGSVTAKNFPVALSEAFEQAIVRAARKRGRLSVA